MNGSLFPAQRLPDADVIGLECPLCVEEFDVPRIRLVMGERFACPACGAACSARDVANDG